LESLAGKNTQKVHYPPKYFFLIYFEILFTFIFKIFFCWKDSFNIITINPTFEYSDFKYHIILIHVIRHLYVDVYFALVVNLFIPYQSTFLI